jgi:hypothetical protein
MGSLIAHLLDCLGLVEQGRWKEFLKGRCMKQGTQCVLVWMSSHVAAGHG